MMAYCLGGLVWPVVKLSQPVGAYALTRDSYALYYVVEIADVGVSVCITNPYYTSFHGFCFKTHRLRPRQEVL